MKSLQLFEQLVYRYLIQPPQNPTSEEMEYFDEWQKPIQRKWVPLASLFFHFLSLVCVCMNSPALLFDWLHRVINVVRWWVENYWQDFNNNVVLLGRLLEFGEMIKAAGFEAEAEQLEASMLAQV